MERQVRTIFNEVQPIRDRDPDDESVAGLIEQSALERVTFGWFGDPPVEIASDDRLCKLFRYAGILRSFGYSLDRRLRTHRKQMGWGIAESR